MSLLSRVTGGSKVRPVAGSATQFRLPASLLPGWVLRIVGGPEDGVTLNPDADRRNLVPTACPSRADLSGLSSPNPADSVLAPSLIARGADYTRPLRKGAVSAYPAAVSVVRGVRADLVTYPASPVLTVQEFGATWTLEAPGVARTNWLPQSQNASLWLVKANLGTVVASGSIGGVTTYFVPTGGTGDVGHYVAQDLPAIADGTTTDVFVILKYAGKDACVMVKRRDGTAQNLGEVNLQTGANFAGNATATNLGDGYWLLRWSSIAFLSGATTPRLYVYPRAGSSNLNYAADGTGVIVGPAMVGGAGRYIATTTAPVASTDVTSYDPATGTAVLGADATNPKANGLDCAGGPRTFQVPPVITTYPEADLTGWSYTAATGSLTTPAIKAGTTVYADNIPCTGSGSAFQVPPLPSYVPSFDSDGSVALAVSGLLPGESLEWPAPTDGYGLVDRGAGAYKLQRTPVLQIEGGWENLVSLGSTDGTNLLPYSDQDPGWTAYGTTPPTVQKDVTVGGERCVEMVFPAGASGWASSRASGSSGAQVVGTPYRWRMRLRLSRVLLDGESVTLRVTGSTGFSPRVLYPSTVVPYVGAWEWVVSGAGTSAASGSAYAAVDASGLASPLTVWLSRRELRAGELTGRAIPTAGTAVTETDYTLSLDAQGNVLVDLARALEAGARLKWLNAPTGWGIVQTGAKAYRLQVLPSIVIEGGWEAETVLSPWAETNRCLRSEPTVAQLATKSAGLTDSGAVGPFARSIQFQAAEVLDYAYFAVPLGLADPLLSLYVIRDDYSAPVVGSSVSPAADFSIVLNNTTPTSDLTVTPVPGTSGLYRVSVRVSGSNTYATAGVGRYAGQSGKGFRVMGFGFESGVGRTTPSRYKPTTGTALTETDFTATVDKAGNILLTLLRALEPGARLKLQNAPAGYEIVPLGGLVYRLQRAVGILRSGSTLSPWADYSWGATGADGTSVVTCPGGGPLTADGLLPGASFDLIDATHYRYTPPIVREDAILAVPSLRFSGDLSAGRTAWMDVTGVEPGTSYYFSALVEVDGLPSYGADGLFKFVLSGDNPNPGTVTWTSTGTPGVWRLDGQGLSVGTPSTPQRAGVYRAPGQADNRPFEITSLVVSKKRGRLVPGNSTGPDYTVSGGVASLAAPLLPGGRLRLVRVP